jgi:hypothetical protein
LCNKKNKKELGNDEQAELFCIFSEQHNEKFSLKNTEMPRNKKVNVMRGLILIFICGMSILNNFTSCQRLQ